MAYTPKTWQNGPQGGTPITATDLNHLETQYDEVINDITNGEGLTADRYFPSADETTNLFDDDITDALGPALGLGQRLAGTGFDLTGTNDSTAAFQAAISTGGVFLGVPGAVYRLGNVSVPAGTRLIGNGAAIVSTLSVAGAGVLQVSNSTDVEISGWKFSGALKTVAVKIVASSRVKVTDNYCSNVTIALSQSTSDAYANSAEGACRFIDISSNRAVASNENNGWAAICLRYTSDSTVSNNQIQGYGHGIQWWGGDSATDRAGTRKAQRISITGNTVTDVGAGGIWGSMGRNITVVGNAITKGGDVGIDFEGCQFSSATGNTVEDFVNGGLAVFFAADHCTFAGNTVVQTGSGWPCFAALSQATSTQIVVSANVFVTASNGTAAIYCDERTISDSLFEGNDVTVQGGGAEAARFNQCDRIRFLNNTVAVKHHTAVGHYGGVDSQYEGNQFTTTADTSAVGTGGGVMFQWVSSTKSAQRMRVRGNSFIGFVTGVKDDCGGDATSNAVIEGNRATAIWHRGTANYKGLIVDNRTSDPTVPSSVIAV